MRIGITGGNGFIGGHVAEQAILRGHDVVVLDRHGHFRPPVDGLLRTGRLTVNLGDVRNDVDMTELAAHTDGIIHLAACLGTQETIQNPRPASETNILGGVNWLQACAQYGVPGVYIGVGNAGFFNSYSITKTTIEHFVTMYNRERNTNVNIVRLVNAMGPRQSVAPPFGPAKVRKIGPAFICRALTGQDIEIYGDGEQISDVVAVEDGALALVLALEAAARGEVLDRPVCVGTEKSHTVNEIAREVIRATGSSSRLVHLPMRPGEIPGAVIRADLSTLGMIGMKPGDLRTMPQVVANAVNYFREHWLPGWLDNSKSLSASRVLEVDRGVAHAGR